MAHNTRFSPEGLHTQSENLLRLFYIGILATVMLGISVLYEHGHVIFDDFYELYNY